MFKDPILLLLNHGVNDKSFIIPFQSDHPILFQSW
jgi:hypothetical protein